MPLDHRCEDRLESGAVREEPTLGADPLGLLIYDRAGNFAAQFMKRERPAVVASEGPTTVATESDTGEAAAFATLVSNNSTAVGGCATHTSAPMTAADGVPVVRTLRWRREA